MGKGVRRRNALEHTHMQRMEMKENASACVCVCRGQCVCVFGGKRFVVVECLCVSVFVALNSILDAINTNYIQLNN